MAKKKNDKQLTLAQRINRIKTKIDEIHQCNNLLLEEGISPDQDMKQREYALQSELRKLMGSKRPGTPTNAKPRQAKRKVKSHKI